MLMECSAKYASTSEDGGALGAEVDAVGVGTAGEDSSGVCFFFLSFFERLEGDATSGVATSVAVSSRLRFFFFSDSEVLT